MGLRKQFWGLPCCCC